VLNKDCLLSFCFALLCFALLLLCFAFALLLGFISCFSLSTFYFTFLLLLLSFAVPSFPAHCKLPTARCLSTIV